MPDDNVDIRIKLEQAAKFIADAKRSAEAIEKTGKSTERAGGRAKRGGLGFKMFGRNLDGSRKAAGRASTAFGGMMRRMAGMAAAYIGISQARSAVTNTMDLAKATFGLTRATSMSNMEASRWAGQAKTRGIDAKALNMAFGTLSKNMDMATRSSGNQRDQFKRLGITTKELKAMGGEISPLMMEMSDGFDKVGPGATRTRAMMTLMGRGWQTITPMMAAGSAELREHLRLADKYGVAFGDTTADKLKSFIAKQREMKMATLGMQVAFTTMVAPHLTNAMGGLANFVAEVRSGTGAGGDFADKLKQIWGEAKPIVTWMGNAGKSIAEFVEHHPALRKVAIAIVAVGLAVKTIRFLGAITGVSTLLGGLGRLAKTQAGERAISAISGPFRTLWASKVAPLIATMGTKLKTTMGIAGATAGTTAGTRMSGTMATSGSAGVVAASSKGGLLSKGFATAGRLIGPVMGLAIAVPLISELNNYMKNNFSLDFIDPGARGGPGGTQDKDARTDYQDKGFLGSVGEFFGGGQSGGPIGKMHGPRGDRLPLMTEHGEFLLRRDIVRKYGVNAISALNRGDPRPLVSTAPSTVASALPTRPVKRADASSIEDGVLFRFEYTNEQPIVLDKKVVGKVLGREIEDLRTRR